MNKIDRFVGYIIIVSALATIYFIHAGNNDYAFSCALGMLAATYIRATMGRLHKDREI